MIYKNIIYFFLVLGGCLSFSYAANHLVVSQPETTLAIASEDPPVDIIISDKLDENNRTKSAMQIALLLDTSGSMAGLIEQAKSQLWNILNELAKTTKGDETPTLEIALYEYGNPTRSTGKYEIHQLSEFTTDMDFISEQLFSLKTNGGDEYCGAVIKASIDELDWTNHDGLKMIYIAGNEPFTQGPIGYKSALKSAGHKDVVVNTIYCSDGAKGDDKDWRQGAKIGGGEYFTINHNEVTAYVETPFDDEIGSLNSELNKTYKSYNKKGESKVQNMILQDNNAGSYSKENTSSRAKFKASKAYKSDSWDLVEGYKKDKSIIKNAKFKDERLKNMTPEELEVEIESLATKREEIKTKINDLDKKRADYKLKLKKQSAKDNLGNSIINTVRKQAKKKGYKTEGAN